MVQPFKKVQSQDYVTSQIQDNIEVVVNSINSSLIINGNLLSSVSLLAGQDNLVAHKLGRIPQFWIVARQNTNTTVWETTSRTDANYLALRCGSNCSINLWVG